MGDTEKGTIGLIQGFGHDESSWRNVQARLKEKGFDSITLGLPTKDPTATSYERYAARAAAELAGLRIDLLAAHSAGAHLVPYLAKLIGPNIKRRVYISGSLGYPSPGPYNLPPELTKPRGRITKEYRDSLQKDGNGLMRVDPALLDSLFFNACKDGQTLPNIQPQCHPEDEPPLEAHRLDIPGEYWAGKRDMVRNRDWAEKAAGHLGLQFIEREGWDHCPATSYPEELGGLLADLAGREQPQTVTNLPTQRREPSHWVGYLYQPV